MTNRSIRFDTGNAGFDRFGNETPSLSRTVLSWIALLAMTGLVGMWFYASSVASYATERDPATLCLENAPTPKAELSLLDTTDPLASDAGQHFTRVIGHISGNLPRNGRLTIVPFGGDLGQPLEVVFDVCSPGDRSDADILTEGPGPLQRGYQDKFLEPLNQARSELIIETESPQSPIAEQIMRATNDPTIGWVGDQRVLHILSDGLQSTANSPIYRTGEITLPPPPPDLLAGVIVNFYELASARHSTLQTPEVRAAWKQWFEQAGAFEVNMYAPGIIAN